MFVCCVCIRAFAYSLDCDCVCLFVYVFERLLVLGVVLLITCLFV